MTKEQQPPTGEGDDMGDIKRSFAVIGAELGNVLHKLAPAEARQHFKSAHLEALKGLRVLIDHRIDHLSSDQKKGTSITVE